LSYMFRTFVYEKQHTNGVGNGQVEAI
jgi:hypothetical protein